VWGTGLKNWVLDPAPAECAALRWVMGSHTAVAAIRQFFWFKVPESRFRWTIWLF
jgi:hypothetical protein